MNKYLDEYLNFRSMVDNEISRLEELHGDNIVCRKGCFDCCTNLTVFPVEFFSILDELKNGNIHPALNESASCAFLDEKGTCMIYSYRPIICRTHGLPIAFQEIQEGSEETAVSFCDNNFTEIDLQAFVFDSGNTLNIDNLNKIFYQINFEYVRHLNDESLNPAMRIDLRELVQFL